MKKTYFPHDSNARNDIKIIKLRSKLGFEGYGIYFAVLELLFSEENKLCVDDYDVLAFGLQCNPKILKQEIENFGLFVIEKKCFYSKRLNVTIDDIYTKSKKAQENAQKRWNNANAMRPHSHRNSDRNASKVNESKVNESKLKNNNKGNFDYYNNISFPDYYDIHYAKRIEKDSNKTKEYHKHLKSIGYEQRQNRYDGKKQWVKPNI